MCLENDLKGHPHKEKEREIPNNPLFSVKTNLQIASVKWIPFLPLEPLSILLWIFVWEKAETTSTCIVLLIEIPI